MFLHNCDTYQRTIKGSLETLLNAPLIPGSKNYWSDVEVTSTQYNLNITPMCFAAWDASSWRTFRVCLRTLIFWERGLHERPREKGFSKYANGFPIRDKLKNLFRSSEDQFVLRVYTEYILIALFIYLLLMAWRQAPVGDENQNTVAQPVDLLFSEFWQPAILDDLLFTVRRHFISFRILWQFSYR